MSDRTSRGAPAGRAPAKGSPKKNAPKKNAPGKSPAKTGPVKSGPEQGERLQKILARAGIAARRKIEELIREGRVTVNGALAELGTKADPARDAIKVDGKRVQTQAAEQVYLLLNKPRGVMSTAADPEGRRTVLDLVPVTFRKALVPVGRLDFNTEGLLLLTNDGEFAHHVSHPRYGCTKTYELKVAGEPEERDLDRLRAGVVLEGKRTAPARIEARKAPAAPRAGSGENSWWTVVLSEGRTRQIRDMFARIGHPVQKLRRVAIGPLSDRALPVGALRELTASEVERLRRSTRHPKARPPRPPRATSSSPAPPRENPPREKPARGKVLREKAPREQAPRDKARTSTAPRARKAR